MSINIESAYSFDGSLIKESSLDELKTLGYHTLGLVDNTNAFFYYFYKELKKANIKAIFGLRIKTEYFDIIGYPINMNGYSLLSHFASSNDVTNNIDPYTIPNSKDIKYVFDLTYLEKENIDKVYELSKIFTYSKVFYGLDLSFYPCLNIIYPLIKQNKNIILIKKVKYLKKEHQKASIVLSSILKGKEIEENNLFNFLSMDYSISSYLDYVNEFSEFVSLIKNTDEFSKDINLEFDTSYHFPKYTSDKNLTSEKHLRSLSLLGLKKRLSGTSKDINKYKERLEYELKIINEMGYNDYFLVVYDYILYAKKNGIMVGPGRGSSVSSLVSYSLGIVDMDPIEYDLFFERFLNPSRVTMPDIDTDFDSLRRSEVIDYIRNKYGIDNVSLIGTYQTLQAKSLISSISQALKIDSGKVNLITKEIKKDDNIKSLLLNPKIIKYIQVDSEIKELFDYSILLESIPINASTHASGIIISSIDIKDLSIIKKNQTVLSGETYKDLGFVKMDILSLSNLTTLDRIIKLIKKTRGIDIELNKIPLNDPRTYKLLNSGYLSGIFQLDTLSAREAVKELKTSSFYDLIASLALNRPGPKEYIKNYVARKLGKEKIDYYDESIKSILEPTYGIIIYQEQLMNIAKAYSSFTLAKADILRKAMSSKDSSLIDSLKEDFFKGAKALNRDINVTNRLYNDILKFSEYGFPKAHSVAYTFITYSLAYLKANYKEEFMSVIFDSDPKRYIKECAKIGVNVLPPDLRYSKGIEYTLINNKIYLPYNFIHGIDNDTALKIESIKPNKFEEVISISKKIISRNIIESLIYSSVFNYTSLNKRTLIESLDGLYEFDPTLIKGFRYKIREKEEFDNVYLRNKEYESLGLNILYHPIKLYKGKLPKLSDIKLSNDSVSIIALVSNIKTTRTKTNESMCVLSIEDEYIKCDAVLFPQTYYKYSIDLKNNELYELTGTYNLNKGTPQFIVRILKHVDF